MLIPTLNCSTERDAGTSTAPADNNPSRPRFANVLEQCSPPFAPWPLATGEIKTPITPLPSQITQPAERGRREGQRRERG